MYNRQSTINHIAFIKTQARQDARNSIFHSYEYNGAVNTLEQKIYEAAYDAEFAAALEEEMNLIMEAGNVDS